MSLSSISEDNPHPYRKGLDCAIGAGYKGLCDFYLSFPSAIGSL